jgi:UDP-N-acetylglucosamine 2-epimerase (non-hydrolysing)
MKLQKMIPPAAQTLESHCGSTDWAKSGFAVITLHRPSNVDDPVVLRSLLTAIREISRRLPV